MLRDDAQLLLSSVNFQKLGDVFQSAVEAPQAPAKSKSAASRDEQVFFEAMASSMKSKGASAKLISSQIRRVRPQIRKDVGMKIRQHKQKHLRMTQDGYVQRFVYSRWAREAGFAAEYRKARRL